MSKRWSVNQFAQIVHHEMCAMMFQLLSVSLARDSDHESEVAVKPGLDSRDGVLDDDGPCRLNSKQPCPNEESIGSGFSGQVLCLDHGTIDTYFEQIVQLGGLQDSRAVFTRGDDRYFEPVTSQLTDEPNASLVSSHPHVLDGLGDQSVLAVPEPAHRFRLRRGGGVFLPQFDAPLFGEMPNPGGGGLVVRIQAGGRNGVEGLKGFGYLRGTLVKVFIEHLFPARRVDLRSVRNYAVEIKQDRVVPVTVDHACALGPSHRSSPVTKGHPSIERQSPRPGPPARHRRER